MVIQVKGFAESLPDPVGVVYVNAENADHAIRKSFKPLFDEYNAHTMRIKGAVDGAILHTESSSLYVVPVKTSKDQHSVYDVCNVSGRAITVSGVWETSSLCVDVEYWLRSPDGLAAVGMNVRGTNGVALVVKNDHNLSNIIGEDK